MWLLIFQRITFDFFIHLFYFPLWWYTGGLKRAALFALGLLRAGNAMLAPGLWLKNLFVPMFGQVDWQGRLVSVFIRFCNVIIRAMMLAVWLVAVVAIFVAWPLFPLAVFFLALQAL